MSIFMLFIASSGNWTRIMTCSLTSMILQNIMKEVSEEEVTWCFLLYVVLLIIVSFWEWNQETIQCYINVLVYEMVLVRCFKKLLHMWFSIRLQNFTFRIFCNCHMVNLLCSHSFCHSFQRCHGAWLSEYSAGQLPEEGCRSRTAWATRSLCGSWYPRRTNGIPRPLNIGSGAFGELVLVLVTVVDSIPVYWFILLFGIGIVNAINCCGP